MVCMRGDTSSEKARQMFSKRLFVCLVVVASWLTASCRDDGLQGPARHCDAICQVMLVGCPFFYGDDLTQIAIDDCASDCVQQLDEAPERCAKYVDEAVLCVKKYVDCDEVAKDCGREVTSYYQNCYL